MKLIIVSLAFALALATPARADLRPGEAAIVGAIVGALIANGSRERQRHTQPVPQYHQPTIHWNQQCGWYEKVIVYWDRIVYQRFNACDHTLIGERWEQR
jgi:hypothetical protein